MTILEILQWCALNGVDVMWKAQPDSFPLAVLRFRTITPEGNTGEWGSALALESVSSEEVMKAHFLLAFEHFCRRAPWLTLPEQLVARRPLPVLDPEVKPDAKGDSIDRNALRTLFGYPAQHGTLPTAAETVFGDPFLDDEPHNRK
jgi:hypothetical protein